MTCFRCALHLKYWFLFAFLSCYLFTAAQEVAFTLPEKDLIPEGIGWSEKFNTFYISSIHRGKIIAYHPGTQSSRDFITSNQDGYDAGLGIIVDDKRNRLWSCSGIQHGNQYSRGIFCWELSTGRLIHKYQLLDTTPQLFNDLALDRNGNVYVTDTYGSKIYFFNTELPQPVLFLSDISFPNGIASDCRNKLYIASHNTGIIQVDLKTKAITHLEKDSIAQQQCTPLTYWRTSKGIDGLKYYKGSLIGVQNGFRSPQNHKLTRYFPERKKWCFSEIEIMDERNPHFVIPTTGVVAGRYYYLIANSNLSYLDQINHIIPEPDKLAVPVILRYKL